MARLSDTGQAGKKRKKDSKDTSVRTKRRAIGHSEEETGTIQRLEDEITESRKYYNNIVTLLDLANNGSANIAVAISLCRVFCRLLAQGQLKQTKGATEQDSILVSWLRERYQEYQIVLIKLLGDSAESNRVTAVTLCMRLMKEHSSHYIGGPNSGWNDEFFSNIITTLVKTNSDDRARVEFANKFLKEYHDVSVYTVQQLSNYMSTKRSSAELNNIVYLLSQLGSPPPTGHKFDNFFTGIPKASQKGKGPLVSVTSFKQRVQAAWLLVLSQNLEKSLRKQILQMMTHEIVPWFVKPELLMDFLTDCCNHGGSLSLLALSGLFYLIQHKNLDYPQFYPKLYSLLDANILHSKHRSRFFRLLDTFLASTHLPATLVASFIKRLSRLALNAPPAAIVAIVPWIYNLFKAHPTCTFMMHREIMESSRKDEIEIEGMKDPYDPLEPDPTLAAGIESSIWEIEMLQSHYHPNVAALARIISEQFTKQGYNLEDFLDHSYQALLETELGTEEKPLRKPPVVEFEIPKRIFTDRLLAEDGGEDTAPGALLRQLWDFK